MTTLTFLSIQLKYKWSDNNIFGKIAETAKERENSMKETAELLKEHRLKVTPQRLKILSIIDKEGHVGIEGLYTRMYDEFPSISLATIYKNINQMMEKGLIEEIKLPAQKSVYEIVKEPHLHMVCDRCRKVEDIVLGTDKIIEEAEKISGYTVTDSFITLRGVCPACREKNAS